MKISLLDLHLFSGVLVCWLPSRNWAIFPVQEGDGTFELFKAIETLEKIYGAGC